MWGEALLAQRSRGSSSTDIPRDIGFCPASPKTHGEKAGGQGRASFYRCCTTEAGELVPGPKQPLCQPIAIRSLSLKRARNNLLVHFGELVHFEKKQLCP